MNDCKINILLWQDGYLLLLSFAHSNFKMAFSFTIIGNIAVTTLKFISNAGILLLNLKTTTQLALIL